jgi:natural product precursor
MKTLGKLKINSEQELKNHELLSLKGGSGWCGCYANDRQIFICGAAVESEAICHEICWEWFGTYNDIEADYTG